VKWDVMNSDESDFLESMEDVRKSRHEEYLEAERLATNEAEKIDWLNNKTQLQETLANLGGKIGDEYNASVDYCTVSNGIVTTGIPSCFHTEAMCAERLLWIAERTAGISNDPAFSSISAAFFNYLCVLSNDGDKPIANFDKWYHPMRAISLVFFNQADALMQTSSVAEALDKVAEAFLAKGYYEYMLWHEVGGKDERDKLSQYGRSGGAKRHAAMNELRDWTIEQYQAGEWVAKKQSANKAAHDLKAKVLAHGRKIEAHLSEANAQRTIADWIRKSV